MYRILLANKIHLGRYKFSQPEDHLLLLERIAGDYVNGHIQIYSSSGIQNLSIFLQEGKIIYACITDNKMWKIFDSKLQALSRVNASLNLNIYNQIKNLFKTAAKDKTVENPCYLAICWLVNERYITPQEAENLVRDIVLDLIKSLQKHKEATYEFISQSVLDDMPKFCYIDIASLVKTPLKITPHVNFNSHSNSSLNLDSNTPILINQELLPSIAVKTRDIYSQEKTTKTYKILCIDDSPTILKTIKSFLDEQSFNVISVDEPLKALMQTIRHQPDIILLDISMPEIDGYELCSLLRKHRHFRDTPIIMVTSKNSLIDKARAKIVKASGYLTKPFSKADLLKVLFHQIGNITTSETT